jgi:S-(hydroxymethyl)glutathione dehydrogenase / alcohol dehydrogenase
MPSCVRAVLVDGDGRPPVVETIELADPMGDEVRVRIAATGICHTDLNVARAPLPPLTAAVLGHEGAGVVDAVGPHVTRFEPGDRVLVSAAHHCGHCRWCESGYPTLCVERGSHRERLSRPGGSVVQTFGTGTFAEATVLRERSLARVPDDVPLEVAALIGCAVVTGAGAVVNDAQLRPGSTAVVLGCGGVGLSAVMAARMSGAARVVAVDPNPVRREQALLVGATDAVAPEGDAALELEPGGYDYAFESTGLVRVMEQAVALTGLAGTTTLMGLVEAGERLALDVQGLVIGNKRLLGVNMGRLRPHVDIPELFRAYRTGLLPLNRLTRTAFGLEEAAAAFEAAVRGDVVRVQLVAGAAA